VINGFDSGIPTGGVKGMFIAIGQSKGPECFSVVTGQELLIIPKLVTRDLTLGALAIVCASH